MYRNDEGKACENWILANELTDLFHSRFEHFNKINKI